MDGALRSLQNSSFPIGIVDDATYDDDVVRLEQGDQLWLYSDGVVEPMNEQGDQFGNDRLEAELRGSNTIPVDGGVERLLRIVERWTGHKGPQDDISIVALSISKE